MTSFKTSLAIAALTFCLAGGSAFAQTTAPATPDPATTTTPAPAAAAPTMTKAQRTAMSKACSADAHKQNLHGKPRKKFMQYCKKKSATM